MEKEDINELVVFKRTCEKCGHSWFPRAGNPQRCPRCQTWLSKLVDGEEAPTESRTMENKPG